MKFFATVALICWVIPVSATIIDNGDYTTINGLDWLDLSATINMSVSDALAANSSYKLATKSMNSSFFNPLGK